MRYVLWTVLILAAPLLAAAAVWYQKAYIDGTKPKVLDALKAHKKMYAVITLLYAGMALFLLATQDAKQLHTDLLIQNLLLWDGLVCLSVTDLRVKKIPNPVTLLLLLLRCGFILYGVLAEQDSLKDVLLKSVIGLLFAGGFILLCMLLSRGGIGAGDMKIFAVIGFYFGFAGVLEVMIYALLLSAVWAIGMLICKKGKLKSTLPMAPFILSGLTVYYLLLTNMELMV